MTALLFGTAQKPFHSLPQGTAGHGDLSARYQQPPCARVVRRDQRRPMFVRTESGFREQTEFPLR